MNFYTFQPVQMHRNILVNLVPVQMGKVVVLCDNTSHRIRGKFGLWNVPGWINGLVNDVWVTAKIRSLPEIKLPILTDEDTNLDKLNKTLLYEWGSARLELDVLLGDSLGNWASFGEAAIKNSNGYRYRKHRVLDMMTDNPGFQLEENYKVGVRLVNVGFGDLTSSDKLDIIGTWTQEFIAVQQQPPYVVVNNYGSTATPTTTPTSNAVLSLTLSSGTVAYPVSGTQITANLSKATASKTYTATWRRDGTDTLVTTTFVADANGNAVISFDTSAFISLGAGKYSLTLTDNGKIITSNEITCVMPSLVVSPTTAYNWSASTITSTITGLALNTTYTLEFVGVSGTSASRTQTAESTAFTTSGSLFTTPGTYKARLTKGSYVLESNEILIQAQPTITLTTPRSNIAFFAEDTQVTFRTLNLQKNATFTYYWIKGTTQVATGSGTSDANGTWEGTFPCSIFLGSPYNGEGIFKLRVTQGSSIDISSGTIETRQLKYNVQPAVNQVYNQNENFRLEVFGIPVGATFTYSILKAGVVQGSPVSQTSTNLSTVSQQHAFELNSRTIRDTYGASNAYSIRVNYLDKVLVSNTFSIQPYVQQALG